MAEAERRLENLEERIRNLELFVIGILKAFEADGRVNPTWLEQVRGSLGPNQPTSEGLDN